MIYLPILDYFIIGKGPVVLFLHGWGQNKEMMLPIINKLKNNYTCIAIDMPGFGNSDFNNESNLDEYCKTISDFLLLKLHVKPKYIIGHSFGGKVAINYYLKYKKIKGIVLIASPVLKPKRKLNYYFKVFVNIKLIYDFHTHNHYIPTGFALCCTVSKIT